MAFLLGCENLYLDYPAKTLFDHVTIGVNDGDRIGIVGRNGDGKSTLLGLIAGLVEPEDGQVTARRGLTLGYLKQTDELDPTSTVRESILGDAPDYIWASDPKIRSILAGLVGDLDGQMEIGSLSGGQRRRVDLARVLVADSDVLLLDEPTNHLDIVAIRWLAEHLKHRWPGRSGALLVVTHDRWFLDEVCESMWEVHDGGIEPFEGGFSAYVLQKVQREEDALRAEQKRQNQMRRELAWLSRGARARSSKPKFHLDIARTLIADVPDLRDPIELKRTAVARLGKQVIDLFGVTAGYDGSIVLDDVTWAVGAGDRYGILGVNGAGKTTLIELIRGHLKPEKGWVRIGKTVKMAVLSQDLAELSVHDDERVREVIGRYRTSYVVDGKELSPSQLLERLGFDRRELSTPVGDLSGGQRRRLQLLLTLLDEPNVLILDEPGNDMDTEMLAIMEDLLDTWPGTLLLVTHDRYLMERVTDDQFALMDGKLTHVPGGVDQYLRLVDGDARADASGRTDGNAAASAIAAAEPRNSTPHGNAPVGPTANGKAVSQADGKGTAALSNAQSRELRKRIQSTERKLHTLEGRESDAREALAGCDPTDYVALGEKQAAIDAIVAQRNVLEEEWLELSEQLEC